jgi:hypothetical protein
MDKFAQEKNDTFRTSNSKHFDESKDWNCIKFKHIKKAKNLYFGFSLSDFRVGWLLNLDIHYSTIIHNAWSIALSATGFSNFFSDDVSSYHESCVLWPKYTKH